MSYKTRSGENITRQYTMFTDNSSMHHIIQQENEICRKQSKTEHKDLVSDAE